MFDELLDFIDRQPQIPDQVVLAFEHSERLLPKLMTALGGGMSIRSKDDKRDIPVILMVTPKSARSPFLEMADHIAWRAQRARKETRKGRALGPWFTDVFPRPPSARARYQELRVGTLGGQGKTLEFLPGNRVRLTFNPT